KRLSFTNRIVNGGDWQTADEVEKSSLIAGRMIATTTEESHEPAIIFNLEKNRAAFSLRRRRLHVSTLPVASEAFGDAIHPASVTEVRIDDDLLRCFVSEVTEPARCASRT